jgi:hypothetical protein
VWRVKGFRFLSHISLLFASVCSHTSIGARFLLRIDHGFETKKSASSGSHNNNNTSNVGRRGKHGKKSISRLSHSIIGFMVLYFARERAQLTECFPCMSDLIAALIVSRTSQWL